MAKFVSVEFDVNFKNIVPNIRRQQRAIDNLPKEALDYFVAQTPVRSGQARRSTRLSGDTIRADYAYAGKLDAGASQQSPRGMTQPTEEYIVRRFKSIFGK